jgi:hypothetical protein
VSRGVGATEHAREGAAGTGKPSVSRLNAKRSAGLQARAGFSDASLRQCVSPAVWFTDEAIATWRAAPESIRKCGAENVSVGQIDRR